MSESPIVESKTVSRHLGVAEQPVACELFNRGARDRGRVLVPLKQELKGDFAGTGTVGHRVLVREEDAVYLTELRSRCRAGHHPEDCYATLPRRRR